MNYLTLIKITSYQKKSREKKLRLPSLSHKVSPWLPYSKNNQGERSKTIIKESINLPGIKSREKKYKKVALAIFLSNSQGNDEKNTVNKRSINQPENKSSLSLFITKNSNYSLVRQGESNAEVRLFSGLTRLIQAGRSFQVVISLAPALFLVFPCYNSLASQKSYKLALPFFSSVLFRSSHKHLPNKNAFWWLLVNRALPGNKF